jgi:hypothetical protein
MVAFHHHIPIGWLVLIWLIQLKQADLPFAGGQEIRQHRQDIHKNHDRHVKRHKRLGCVFSRRQTADSSRPLCSIGKLPEMSV